MAYTVRTPKVFLLSVWPLSLSLATTRKISVDFSSSRYLDVSVPGVPHVTLCIYVTFHGSSPWVFPHSEICGYIAYLQLPAAYRSLSRPSSAPDAKAFALCSYSLELSYQWFLKITWFSSFSELLEFHKTFFRLFPLCSLKTFSFCALIFFFHLSVKLFLPYFYRKTYTNLLIFVLFVCSFFLLFNLSSFIRFSMINQVPPTISLALVGTSGLEPPTSRLSGARSNHLSYAPLWLLRYFFPHVPLVEMMGIEPMTPCLQGRCSPSWATPPSVWVSFSFLLISHWKLNNKQS